MSYWEESGCGRRRRFQLRLLSEPQRGACCYPRVTFHHRNALYRATESLVYSVVLSEPPNEYGYNELAWANIGEIRLWGALAFAIAEGRGFYSFHPSEERNEAELSGGSIWAENLDVAAADRYAQRLASRMPKQQHELHWVAPDAGEIAALYDALLQADNVLLRGVNCYLKSHILWRHPLFMEEMGINLYIALEAGLATLRRRFSAQAGRDVSYRDVHDHIRKTFTYGDALVDYWEDCRDDRHIVIHPDCDLGAEVMHPRNADDIYELFDPMLSLYRYILLGKPRPTFEEITGRPDPNVNRSSGRESPPSEQAEP